MLSMQIAAGAWPAHGTKLNPKISQRTFGVARRGEEGAQQGSKPLLREKGEHLPVKGTPGQQKGKRRSRFEAGMLTRGCLGEREGEQGAARQGTRECLCVSWQQSEEQQSSAHTKPSPGAARDPGRCVQPAELSVTACAGFDKARKRLELITFRRGIFLYFKQCCPKPTDLPCLQKGFLDTHMESKQVIFSSLSTSKYEPTCIQ